MKTPMTPLPMIHLPRQFVATLLTALLLSGLFSSTLPAATGNPPDRISYKGFLTDASGNPLAAATPENHTIIFRIYDASQGGNLIWSEQQTVTIDNGVFSVLLGEGSDFQTEPRPVPISLVFQGATASDRFVGVTVTPGGELAPRMQLLASPYAFLAASSAELVGPFCVDPSKGPVLKGFPRKTPGYYLTVTLLEPHLCLVGVG